MARSFVLSDLHLQHKNILKFRTQFNTVEEHDNFIMTNILSIVGKRDTLWLLGDVFLPHDEESFLKCREYLKQLVLNNLQVKFILGNHCTDGYWRYLMIREMLNRGEIHGLVKYKKAWLSHAPIHESELRGKFNIYGHTHSNKVNNPMYYPVSCEHLDYKPRDMKIVIDELIENNKGIINGFS